MKVYEGERTLKGASVTVDGAPLPDRKEVRRFTKLGFEWGFQGPGPQQLALALLADHLEDTAKALALSEPFMRTVVAELDNAWRMTSEEIAAGLREIPAA
jgi:hypothetical protein